MVGFLLPEREELWTVKIRIVNIIRKKRRTIVSVDFIWLGLADIVSVVIAKNSFEEKRGRRGMKSVSFKEQNSLFVAEGCDNLPACKQYNEQFQTDEVISCWEFTDDELVQILKDVKAGKHPRIFLSVIGGQPPVSLFMRSDNHAGND